MFLAAVEEIQEIEQEHEEELLALAEETFREMYGIPSQIKLSPKFKEIGDIDINFESDDEDIYVSPQRKYELNDEIQKRMILNGLSHGSSLKIWKSSHYIVDEKLNKIHPRLM
jgi:hypothetical protein